MADLHIASPRYKKQDPIDDGVAAIAIDSTGLKRFGLGEWHEEKYKLSAKRSWRNLHTAVDTNHFIHACDLTDRFSADCESVETLLKQIEQTVGHITADRAYDKNPTQVWETKLTRCMRTYFAI